MGLTAKQERYARIVASGKDLHTAALEAGCKNFESARKFVADMKKRENVQAFIKQLQSVQVGLGNADTGNISTDISYTGGTSGQQDNIRPAPTSYETPLEFLTSVFNNAEGLYTPKERISAAIALLPYTEQKLAQTGKKEDAIDTANAKSQSGRFATLSNQSDMFVSELQS